MRRVENAGYVVTGWVLTGGVLVVYGVALARRARRARRSFDQPGRP